MMIAEEEDVQRILESMRQRGIEYLLSQGHSLEEATIMIEAIIKADLPFEVPKFEDL